MMLAADKWYISWTCFVVVILSQFYKVYKYGVPQRTVEVEVLILLVVQLLNQLRLYISMKANKVEKASLLPVLSFFLFTFVTFLGFAFFLVMQTFTLLLEVVFLGLAAVLGIFEFGLTCFMLLDFKSIESSQ